MKAREFHLRSVLSVVGNRLLLPDDLEEIADLLQFMTREENITLLTSNEVNPFKFMELSEKCRPHILDQHPELKEVEDEFMNLDAQLKQVEGKSRSERMRVTQKWIEKEIERYGRTLTLEPITPNDR